MSPFLVFGRAVFTVSGMLLNWDSSDKTDMPESECGECKGRRETCTSLVVFVEDSDEWERRAEHGVEISVISNRGEEDSEGYGGNSVKCKCNKIREGDGGSGSSVKSIEISEGTGEGIGGRGNSGRSKEKDSVVLYKGWVCAGGSISIRRDGKKETGREDDEKDKGSTFCLTEACVFDGSFNESFSPRRFLLDLPCFGFSD